MTFLEEHHRNNVLTYLKHGNYYNQTQGNRAFLSSMTRISFFFFGRCDKDLIHQPKHDIDIYRCKKLSRIVIFCSHQPQFCLLLGYTIFFYMQSVEKVMPRTVTSLNFISFSRKQKNRTIVIIWKLVTGYLFKITSKDATLNRKLWSTPF